MEKKNFMDYANSFQAVARLGLENMTALMKNLGNPEEKLRFIHVAGTNGKGSVCAFLQCIFTAAGYKTGKYISPNLISVCERISLNGENISEEALSGIMETVKKAAEKTEKETGVYPTQFELWTAAAFLYFSSRSADLVILETGLGGEKDATNVVKNTVCSVITKIAADHTAYLGNTLSEIAAAKAGIIKKGGFTVSASQSPDAAEVIKKRCLELKNPLYIAAECENIKFDASRLCEVFDYKDLKRLEMRLLGVHQTENAALAIETAKALKINEHYIRQGIFAAQNPARFEIISKKPAVIFDGAHNPNGVAALCAALKRYFPGKRLRFITAAMADKDIGENIKILSENGFKSCPFFTLAVKNNPRSASAEALAAKFSGGGFSAVPCSGFEEIFKTVSDADITVIFGSLYLYKDFAEFWDSACK